jgi:PAS domain S-box-containing protein
VEFRLLEKGANRFLELQVCGHQASVSANRDAGPTVQIHAGKAGTRIRVPCDASPRSMTDEDLAEWAGALKSQSIQLALSSSRQRMEELADELAAARSQRQELESELNEARSLNETLTLLSMVASKTDNVVIVMESAGEISWVNDAFLRTTGYSAQEAIGNRPDELLAGPATDPAVLNDIGLAFRQEHGVAEELLIYSRSGQTSWLSLSLTPIHDDEGRVARWIGIGIGNDITRTRQVQQALETARDAAQTASRLKSEFLANMSHEIRTPMNAVIGMTELCLATSLTDEQREYLSSAHKSARSLLDLLNDVLDLSRIESGKLPIEEHPFDPATLIEDTVDPFRRLIQSRQVELITGIDDEVPDALVGDSLRIRQVLINLIGNAVKFTQQGCITVSAGLLKLSGEIANVQIAISDTGIGIESDKQQQIFDAFSQADASTTRQFGGSGLGLSISWELMRLMGGRIRFESEFGVGSTFFVELKCRVTSESPTEPIADHPETQFDDSEPAQSRLKVLIVDDHEANRVLANRLLTKRGHVCSEAENGDRALEHLQRERFDVVLLDIQMPGRDGFDTCRLIREREASGERIPVIALTAHAMSGDRERCLAAGMDEYLSKPLHAKRLIALIESLCNASAESLRTTNKSWDFTAALARLGDDEELLREQMFFFLRDVPQLLEAVREAVENDLPNEVRTAAHRLTGLCAAYDADNVSRLAARIEAVSQTGDLSSTPELLRELVEGLQPLTAAMKEFLKRTNRHVGAIEE